MLISPHMIRYTFGLYEVCSIISNWAISLLKLPDEDQNIVKKNFLTVESWWTALT